jgi:hypothetical protein
MFNLDDLKENQLQDILATVGTPGFKYLVEALETQINTQLAKLKVPSDHDLEELSFWRGLHAIYTTIVELPKMAANRGEKLEAEREALYGQEPNWAEQVNLPPQQLNFPPDLLYWPPSPPVPPRTGWAIAPVQNKTV